MLFNTFSFLIVFLPLIIAGYFILGKIKNNLYQKLWLLTFSAIFYISFDIRFMFIVAVSILINYMSASLMKKSHKKAKGILVLTLCFNIGILLFFKYFNFFIESFNSIMNMDIHTLNIILPIGISFYTFQQIAFIIDSYRNPEISYNLLDYTNYVLFFPYIIQGPIAYHHEIIPQFNDKERFQVNYENLARGLSLFIIGLSKKVLIADSLAEIANIGFDSVSSLTTTTAVLCMISYTFQIYFDFSGYSDMATGIARMLNIDIPLNFNSPYKAISINDFWKRWHMTLTRFFTKYIYIPLGGNRKSKIRTCLNVLVVFLVSGFWHGANITFILWGFMHGIGSILEKIRKPGESKNQIRGWFITFLLVNLAWVIFRSNSIQDAMHFYKILFSFNFGAIPNTILTATSYIELNFLLNVLGLNKVLEYLPYLGLQILFIISFYIILNGKTAIQLVEEKAPKVRYIFALSLLLCWSIVSFGNIRSFVYVNF